MPTIIHLWFIIKVLFPLHFPQFLNVNEVSLKTNAESVYFREGFEGTGSVIWKYSASFAFVWQMFDNQ